MANANNVQMQSYADTRIRPFAEAMRSLLAQAQDNLAAIADEYARAVAGPLWNDARSDGPPHLLASGPGSSPDDLTNFNALLVAFVNLCTTNAANSISGMSGQYNILLRACVRGVG
jgi:hypothetical protein